MPKVYQILEPFEDPEKEKKRQNAIKAKEARDRKNAEVLGLKKTIEKLQRIKRKQRKSLDHYKIILKSHNIRNPVEESFDEDSDSDMELMEESGNDLGMENTRQTAEPVVRFVLKPVVTQATSLPIFPSGFSTGPNVRQKIETPKATLVSEPVKEVWGNDLGVEINKPIAQAGEIFSSGFTRPNVIKEIETPKATKPQQFEPASQPFSLDDVIMEDLIKNAPVVIDDESSSNIIGDSSTNVPLVHEIYGNPTKTVSHPQMDLKSVPITPTIDQTAIIYNPKENNSPSSTEPEELHKVDKNNFNILKYRDLWNESPQIDLENVFTNDIVFTDDMIRNVSDAEIDPNFLDDF
jgi:hypothetical protein